MGIVTTKPVFGEFAINRDADQHVQPSSLISTLVYRLLESRKLDLLQAKLSLYLNRMV